MGGINEYDLSQNMNNSTVFNSPAEASQWLKQGNLLAYPTESVWGIGCDAYDEQAVKAILAIKNRPINKGMIVATDSATVLLHCFHSLQSSETSS